MYVTTDQLMRWDGIQPLKILISNHIVSPAESCGWVLPDSFPNLTFPFGTSSGRWERHHLERRNWRRGDSIDDGRSGCLTFLLIQFAFLRFNCQLRQRFILHPLNMCIFILAIPGGHFCKNKIKKRCKKHKQMNQKKRKKKEKEGMRTFLFSKYFNTYREGSGPRQWSYRWQGSTKSSKSSILWANSKAALTRLW